MPRALKSRATQKQHKGGRTGKGREKGDHKVEKISTRHKKIKKHQAKNKNKNKQTKIKQMQKLQKIEMSIKKSEFIDSSMKSHIESLIKKQVGIKVILLVPFNNAADVKLLQTQIEAYIREKNPTNNIQQEISTSMEFKFPYFNFFAHPKNFPGLVKQNFLFIHADRNIQTMLDFAKIADIIVPVLSCRQANIEGMTLNPFDNAKAFDELGYEQIQALRQQGMLNSVCVLQDLHLFTNKQDKVLKLFQRFFQSEFESGDRPIAINNFDDIFTLLRRLQTTPETKLPWRDMRGYLLAQKVIYNNDSMIVQGFLKGSAVNANQLVHITGMDDFQIERIQILKSKSKLQRVKDIKKSNQMQQQLNNNIELVQHSFPHDQLKALKEVPVDGEDLIDAFDGLTLSKPLMQEQQEMQEEQEDIQDQQSDISYDDIDNLQDQQKKKKQYMEMRDEQDLQFEDEVQYPVQATVKQLYKEYQGLSSFRTTDINKLENLPRQYNSIFAFKNYQHTLKSAVKDAKQKAFAHPGFYIRVRIKGVPLASLEKHNKQTPLIVSFLLKHQRKMTQIHLRVKRNQIYTDPEVPVMCNKPYQIHLGFRKIIVKPIFSKIIGSIKTKYRDQFTDQDFYFCSFYHYNMYAPAPATIYRINQFNNLRQHVPIMVGTLSKCDPMHVIMKRIILTGYPYKINRRRAVVRYMFFNPKDIKYFKPVELKTKLGLRGNIEQSLGTHGLMKCLFNDMIKPNDTVCLYLYKRVFPQPWF